MYIISKCLLGHNCKYSGGNNETGWVKDFCKGVTFCPVCPEEAGGLPTPREPSERVGDRVVSITGKDFTREFLEGSRKSFEECVLKAEAEGDKIQGAILKSNSPSCGCGAIYDGTFSGTLIEGNGVFAQLLQDNNIDIYTEKERIK